MPDPSHNTLSEAQAAVKAGRKKEAAQILKNLLRTRPDDFRVWLLLATIAPPEKKAACLARAEALAPGQPAVVKARQALGKAPKHQKPLGKTAKVNPPTREAAKAATADPVVERLRSQLLPKTPSKSAKEEVVPVPAKKTTSVLWSAAVGVALILIFGFYWIWLGINGDAIAAEDNLDHQTAQLAAPIQEAKEGDDLQLVAQLAQNSPTSTPDIAPTSTPGPTATPTQSPLQRKEITASNIALTEWTPTPLPTNTPEPTPTLVPTAVINEYVNVSWPAVGPSERWVDVNLTDQWLVAYEGTTPIYETAISSGLAPNYTVTGQFRIYYRLESQTMDGTRLGFDYVTPNVPHVQYFYGDFALHGAYWHNNFGQPMSHGCVNLSLSDAEWLYQWADYGTLVNVHY
ncbi:MAG: L,D-transpeptidase family protein [Ardenticatenaceae bacterium]|nr:L,D-transpeptidase family protein [Ardenticatenaceae bacterium]